MENKNFILAIVLSFAFLFLWSTFIMPRYAHKAAPAPAAVTNTPTAAGTIAAAHPGATASPATLSETILRDAQNEIIFSSQGGGIEHWRLKLKGQEVDLVEKPAVQPLPLTTFPDVNFSINIEARPGEPSKPGSVHMKTVLPNGIRFTKILTLNRDGFLHDLHFQFENPSSQVVEIKDWAWGWGPGLGTAEAERKENSRLIRALSKGKLKAHSLKPGTNADFGEWSGIDNRYFLVAFLPVNVGTTPLSLNVAGTKDQTQISILQPLTIPAKGQVTLQYQLYAGPKGYTQLGKYHKNLEAAVDFGVFSAVGKLILRAVYWLQRQTGNYGFAIILLTICLQLLLLPLTIKSFKATMAMKKLQPQIAALQKNYKSDPKRLNLEMMNLYKKSGTNPFGGCLPMLLQLPIFWALFTTLRNAYELRGAPFIGWIRDLSAADPLHVLPVVMGAGMFLQQRMSGAVTDPTQRQMMYMMPIMFTVMFFNFPAGLVLYWFTQNIITMIIQWALLRRSESTTTLEIVR